MPTCTTMLLTTSIVFLTSNGVFAKSFSESTGRDYFFNLFAPQTGVQKAQRQRDHDAYWEERGKEHGEYWKNTMNVLVKLPATLVNGLTTMMTAVSELQMLLPGFSNPTPIGPQHPKPTTAEPEEEYYSDESEESESEESDYYTDEYYSEEVY